MQYVCIVDYQVNFLNIKMRGTKARLIQVNRDIIRIS